MKSTISSKGQVTVPAAIRDRYGLDPGAVVVFEVREEGVLMRKGSKETHPVDRLYGSLTLPRPVDALVDAMRGPRPKR